MNNLDLIYVSCLSFVASLGIVYLIALFAGRVGLLARLEPRSIHTRPTPQGGGMAPSLVAVVAGLWLASSASDPSSYVILAGLFLGIALLGLIDDIVHVSVRLRFTLQVIILMTLIYYESPLAPMDLFFYRLEGALLMILMLLAGLWWVNLFNFMDGLDGFAGSQAVFMLGSSVLMALAAGATPGDDMIIWMIAVIAAILAFLVFNWAPAKIFLGDSGSLFLGFFILSLAIITVKMNWLTYASWIILAAIFVCDATVTLLIRMAYRVNVLKSHSHNTYNRLARMWNSHQRVTLLTLAVNILWLLPLAWYVNGQEKVWGQAIIVLIAYLPILIATCSIQLRYKDYRTHATGSHQHVKIIHDQSKPL